MKITPWSLALIAGASAAAPPYGGYETDCPEEDPISSAPVAVSSVPAYSDSVPSISEPAPAYSEPVPSYFSSAAVYSSSAAVYSSSAPVYSSSVPVAYSSSVPVGPVSSVPAYSGPVVTNTKTVYTTICPCADGGKPTRTPGEVYTTVTSKEHTTLCNPTEKPYTWGDWTSVYTSYETSTIVESYTITATEPSEPTDPAGYPGASGSYPAGGYPGASGSYPAGGYPGASGSYPAGGYPGASGSYPAGGYPTASASYPAGGYPHPSGSYHAGNSSYPGPTGTLGTAAPTCKKPKPTGSCKRCEGQPGDDQYCGYTIDTDWYDFTPKTCEEKFYDWSIEETTICPDGVCRPAMAVNGHMPGPMIEANWGDVIHVTVRNNMSPESRNGTTLHWHGIRQNGTNEYDGVSSITQCPIAPGDSMTYTFTASSYGTSWWHAHYALQTYEGIFGPIIIHGPGDVGYDGEQMIMMQDWSYATADELYYKALPANQPGGPITLDTGLINGMNVGKSGGQYFSMDVESNKSYRLRIVNTAIQSTFKFHVDGHSFSVVAMDFVPIHPYTTNIVSINIGQRYDLILKADQASGNYWMRADIQSLCGPNANPNVKGIIHYTDAPVANPTTSAIGYAPDCLDEPMDKLKPIVAKSVGSPTDTIAQHGWVIQPQNNLYKWTLSGTTFQAQWGEPTLYSIYENGTIPAEYQGQLAIEVPNLGEWVYVIIDSPMTIPHPIHLHGHDFMVLAQGTGAYSSSVALNLDSPPRRDVAVMPADPTKGLGGYLVVAYYTSNPGVWLMHCHIGWHNAMGFALQIIENLEGIKETVTDECTMKDLCKKWDAYASQYDVFTHNLDAGV